MELSALAVGQEVSVQMGDGTIAQGSVFVFDKANDVLVLEEPHPQSTIKQDVRIFKASLLQKIELVAEAKGGTREKFPLISHELVAKRRKAGIEKAEADIRRIGKNVTPEAQRLFDELNKTYALTWKEQIMWCTELGIAITPPYGPDDCKGRDSQALERIKKVIGSLKERLGI